MKRAVALSTALVVAAALASATRVDPRSGREVFTVTDIVASEPDPGLFTLPKDARIVDVRRPSPQR